MWRKQPESKASSSSPVQNENSTYAQPAPQASSAVPAAQPTPSNQTAAPSFSSSPDASVLTRGIRIRGNLTGKADLVIDGEVDGQIRLNDSRVTVGTDGRVKADIEAREISMNGHLDGHLRAKERISLGSASRMKGNVEAPRVAFEDGAHFKGRVEMGSPIPERSEQQREAPKKAATPPATPPSPKPASAAAMPAVAALSPSPAVANAPALAPASNNAPATSVAGAKAATTPLETPGITH